MVQTQISGRASGIDGKTHNAQAHQEVNELQVAVMQWELTLVEHESKFSEVVADSVKTTAMRAMLPKDVLERFLDGSFRYEELRNRVSAYVGEKLAGQDANGGAQPMDIGQIDKSEGEDDDVNAVQQRRTFDRPYQKHKQESDNEPKPFNHRTTNSSQFVKVSHWFEAWSLRKDDKQNSSFFFLNDTEKTALPDARMIRTNREV